MYSCAQNLDRQHAPVKSSNIGIKHRDKESMDSFDCSGWIHITLSDLSYTTFIKLTHCEDHVPYCPIDIPEDIEKYVRDNLKLTPTQVSNAYMLIEQIFILSVSCGPKFSKNIQNQLSLANPSINCGRDYQAIPGNEMKMKFSLQGYFLKNFRNHQLTACTPWSQYQLNRVRELQSLHLHSLRIFGNGEAGSVNYS